eukprot:scaffold1334_cov344-Prasinococcus_capsulatus_cf.AAC.12
MPRSFHKQVADKLKAHFVTHVQLVGSLDHIVDIRGNIAEDAGAGVKSLQYLNLLRLFYQSEGFEVRGARCGGDGAGILPRPASVLLRTRETRPCLTLGAGWAMRCTAAR